MEPNNQGVDGAPAPGNPYSEFAEPIKKLQETLRETPPKLIEGVVDQSVTVPLRVLVVLVQATAWSLVSDKDVARIIRTLTRCGCPALAGYVAGKTALKRRGKSCPTIAGVAGALTANKWEFVRREEQDDSLSAKVTYVRGDRCMHLYVNGTGKNVFILNTQYLPPGEIPELDGMDINDQEEEDRSRSSGAQHLA